ncbi:MAG TPA: aminoacyl-tRNA synthetase [Noviherbaspirillum sp.]|jgi:hypothetical protein|uniref:aminoacyl-tRNA synthetase n=1 Tax=Noviherbaspirillum sp. TaxID=1926288 RepID=UPI002F9450B6
MSDEEYFRSCVAKERRLAQLLGHEVEEYADSAGTLWENRTPMPRWTRDWHACGALLAEYRLSIAFTCPPGEAEGEAIAAGPVLVRVADHPDRERALMFAIVKAVVHLLEHGECHRMPLHRRHRADPAPPHC